MQKKYETAMPEIPWTSETWYEVNQTAAHLISLHGQKLEGARAIALEIQKYLTSVFPLMTELCFAACSYCPDPCCLGARVWFDFQDLLFLHLSGQQIPPEQVIRNWHDICRYTGLKGCKLRRLSRPWICTWYLCPAQLSNLRRKSRAEQSHFEKAVCGIKAGRKKMEAEFIQAIL